MSILLCLILVFSGQGGKKDTILDVVDRSMTENGYSQSYNDNVFYYSKNGVTWGADMYTRNYLFLFRGHRVNSDVFLAELGRIKGIPQLSAQQRSAVRKRESFRGEKIAYDFDRETSTHMISFALKGKL